MAQARSRTRRARPPAAPNELLIGKRSNDSQFFGGDIAELAIWNIALSDDDVFALGDPDNRVSPLLVRPDALVGYWPLVGFAAPEN